MRLHIPPAHVEPRDLQELERRARELSSGGSEAPSAERVQVVTFRLAAGPCAVQIQAVARAVSRLGRVTTVPLAKKGERRVAFVEEVPVQVLDLAHATGHAARSPQVLETAPAFLVSTAAGSAAIAVEPPLELAEDELAGVTQADTGGPDAPRTLGRLRGGASLLDGDWLLDWAARSLQS